MVYEIYELRNGEMKLDIFVIFQTITMSVVEINTRETIQAWIDAKGLKGFDLDDPTEVMDYRQYNTMMEELNTII